MHIKYICLVLPILFLEKSLHWSEEDIFSSLSPRSNPPPTVDWEVCRNPNGDRCNHFFSLRCPRPGRCQGSLCGCSLQCWRSVSTRAPISDSLCCESGPGARVWSRHRLLPPLLKSGSSDLLPVGGYRASDSPGLVPKVRFSASSPFGRPWDSAGCLLPKSKRKWKVLLHY